jgi:predicted peptidase
MISNVDDGAFHSSVVEMTNADFWKGDVHSLRVNFFAETKSFGFMQYLKSITFCESYEAAQAICVDKKTETTDVRKLFNYGLYTNEDMRMAYRMYVPSNYRSSKTYPLLTFLHGAGQRGDDGLSPVEAVVPMFFDNPSEDVAFDSIVLVPQCPFKYRWVESDWGLGFYYLDDISQSKPMTAYLDILDDVKGRYSVDTDRFYVTGISMGGYGTWDLLMRHGDMFASGMPICGGGDRKKADLLLDIPIRTFHGSADAEVPVIGSQRMYKAIIGLGGQKISYTQLDGYPHNVWDYAYSDSSNMDWLFSHRRSDRD